MTRIKVLLVSLLMVAASMVGAQAPAQAAGPSVPTLSSTHPAGTHALKGYRGATIGMHALTTCASPCYYYAGFKQTVAFDGVSVNASKETPAIDVKAYHSLWELAAFNSTGQTLVEVGWTRDTTVCASGVSVCLFVFYWKNGAPQCYNGCGALNATTCAPYCMGASLDGIANGTLKGWALQHIVDGSGNGAWWAAFDGAWRFAVPDTAFGAYAFARASSFQSFGEVAASDDTTCADMANGVTPTGPPTLLGGRDGALTFLNGSASPNATTFAPTPTRYNSVIANTTSPPVTSIRYGGTGGC
jgi:hypothetical protein